MPYFNGLFLSGLFDSIGIFFICFISFLMYNIVMNFMLVFRFLINKFEQNNIAFALIGGFALQAAGVTRTTKDIDLLVLSKDSQKIKDVMLSHGYDLIHESEDLTAPHR